MKGGEGMRKEGRWRETGAKSKNFSKRNMGGARVDEVKKKCSETLPERVAV